MAPDVMPDILGHRRPRRTTSDNASHCCERLVEAALRLPVVNDHTSVLRLIELRFGFPAVTARHANANALLDLFDFTTPSVPTPPALPPPTITPGQCN